MPNSLIRSNSFDDMDCVRTIENSIIKLIKTQHNYLYWKKFHVNSGCEYSVKPYLAKYSSPFYLNGSYIFIVDPNTITIPHPFEKKKILQFFSVFRIWAPFQNSNVIGNSAINCFEIHFSISTHIFLLCLKINLISHHEKPIDLILKIKN